MTKIQFLIASLCCSLLLGCTATIPTFQVRGELGGQRIATTVDSELARYYVEEYLPGKRTKPNLDEIIQAAQKKNHSNKLPSHAFLKDLSNDFSVDFATLYLANRIVNDDINQKIQSIFYQNLAEIKSAGTIEKLSPGATSPPYTMLFVPGWFYKRDPWTGADLAKQRAVAKRLGFDNFLIEIAENGTIEENATIISKAIARHTQSNKKIILVSVSKAGPEVAYALGGIMDYKQTRSVKAWINIGGLLRGSLIADSALRWPKRWFAKLYFNYQDWDFDSVESMTTEKSRSRFKRLNIPRHILIINYIGIPLSGDVSVFSYDRYVDLRSEGPNDGLTLITDGIMPNSFTIAQLGVDHFFMDPDIDTKTAAMIQTVIELISLRSDL